jgi:hypothetical protein
MLNYETVGLLIRALQYWLARHQKETPERKKMAALLERLFNLQV